MAVSVNAKRCVKEGDIYCLVKLFKIHPICHRMAEEVGHGSLSSGPAPSFLLCPTDLVEHSTCSAYCELSFILSPGPHGTLKPSETVSPN